MCFRRYAPLLMILLALFNFIPASAQKKGADHDVFVGLGGGAHIGLDTQKYQSRSQSHIGAGTAIDIYVGKWLGDLVGVRGGYLGFQTSSNFAAYGETPFHYLHADALFRLGEVFWPYVHAGYVKMDRGTIGGGVGFMFPFKINNYLRIAPDLRMTVLGPGAFPGVEMAAVNFTAGLSLVSRLDHNWTIFKSKDAWSADRNWFAGAGLGFQIGMDFQSTESRGNSHAGAGTAIDAYAGKWMSDHMGFRLGYLGGTTSNRLTVYGQDRVNYLHADLLWMFQPWMIPYLHTGFIAMTRSSWAGGVGLMLPIPLGSGVRIVPDVRFTVHDDKTFKTGVDKQGATLSGTLGVMANLDKLRELKASDRSMRYSLTTNLLDWLTGGVVNLNLGVSVSRHFTLHGAFKVNPWTFHYTEDSQEFKDEQWTASLGARWWPWYVYSGWWAGARLQMANYIDKGIFFNQIQEGRNALGLGLQGGYTLMLNKHLNLDFSLGGWGGILLRHEIYDAEQKTTRKPGGKAWFVAPETIGISLMYVF